ncbi:MAG: hypothetical protein PHP93_04605, partial [Kiritimatiellales bacterium]|nr:hypothetical protein [Kiritimatiellales bacterium]
MKKILLSTRTIVLTLILMFFIAIACFDFGIKMGAKKITRSEKLLTSKESVRRLNASQYLAFVQIACFTDGGSFAYTFLN